MTKSKKALIHEARRLYKQFLETKSLSQVEWGTWSAAHNAEYKYCISTYNISEMQRLLAQADTDFSALDPEGKRSKESFETEFKEHLLNDARRTYGTSKEQEAGSGKNLMNAYDILRYVGENFTALDSTGKRSLEDFQNEFRPIFLYAARRNYEMMVLSHFINSQDVPLVVDGMRQMLADVGLDFSALDPEGKQTAEYFEEQFEKEAERPPAKESFRVKDAKMWYPTTTLKGGKIGLGR